MKRAFIYLFLFAGLLMSWSCEEDSNMDEIGNWEITPAVPSAPSSDATVVLNEDAPQSEINFEWQPATTSNRFGVAYRLVLVDAADNGIENPILEATPGSGGKDRFVKLTADQIDYALWAKCYEAGAAADLKWVVVAKAIEKEALASSPVSITRFATDRVPQTMVITGSATEAGADIANASAMRARVNGDGETTGVFDIYTTLTEGQAFSFRDQASAAGKIFGGSEGVVEDCGDAIASPSTAQYRVTVDLNNDTYDLWKVDKWSLVGDAVPGGWGGDVPLTYIGNGVWQAQIEFLKPYDDAGFIFRANGDWGYIIKQVKGTVTNGGKNGSVIMEGEAGAAGVEVEDSKISDTGFHTVTLDLRNYTFSLVPVPVDPGQNQAVIGKTNNPESDAVTGNFVFGEYDMPDQLFLLSDGEVVTELTKEGDLFKSKYLALQKSKKYTLNSASDGSGTTYNNIGNGEISVDHDQAYTLSVDFAQGKLFWKHFNLKLFHWDDAGGGWDQRQELLMTYSHPYKFEVTGNLFAGFDSKFISPWDVQFGAAGTALTGTMTNGGPNFKGIIQDGTYKATIVVSDDYTEGEYSFVKQ